ncbi:GIY-YIG nuclease family protein [Methylobacterium nodulans]|uniref:GIY-YIG nuclease family protein n=1 Tax=Methylobacterium nodulans TaxID=114616 RepID=UPI0005C16989|nr:GIY-YIG nuclease family protein [Methylobacterium nodulans]
MGLIYAAGYDRFVKIGFTAQSVEERIRTLSTGCPMPIEVISTLPGRQADEIRCTAESRNTGYEESGSTGAACFRCGLRSSNRAPSRFQPGPESLEV